MWGAEKQKGVDFGGVLVSTDSVSSDVKVTLVWIMTMAFEMFSVHGKLEPWWLLGFS